MDLFGENTLVFISILASTSHLILEVLLKLYGNRVWLNDLRFLWRFLACSGVFTIVFVHFKELLDIFSEKNMVTKFLKVFFGRDHKNFYGKENSLKSPLLFSLTKYSGFRNWTFINVQKGKAREIVWPEKEEKRNQGFS